MTDFTKIEIVNPRLLSGVPIADECLRQFAVKAFCTLWSIPDGPERQAVDLASKLQVRRAPR